MKTKRITRIMNKGEWFDKNRSELIGEFLDVNADAWLDFIDFAYDEYIGDKK